jgi:hypothetical protein
MGDGLKTRIAEVGYTRMTALWRERGKGTLPMYARRAKHKVIKNWLAAFTVFSLLASF